MWWINADTAASLLCLAAFIGLCCRRGCFGCLALAAWAWLCTWLACYVLMPYFGGVVMANSLNWVNAYVFVGSLMLWWRNTERVSGETAVWRHVRGGALLSAWAAAMLSAYTAAAVIGLALWWVYPQGSAAAWMMRLAWLHLFEPALWLSLQAVLTMVFLWHRRLAGRGMTVFSLPQLQGGLLLVLLWLFLYISHLDIQLVYYFWFRLLS